MKKCFLVGFGTCIPPQSGGVRNTRFVFRGPIWMRSNNIAVFFALGRCRGRRTSRQDRRSMEAKHLSLVVAAFCGKSRPFAAGPASSLFVVGCRRYPSCDTYQVPGYSYLLLNHAVRFFPHFSAGFSNQMLEDCLLPPAAAVFLLFRYFSRFLLRQSVCARAAWWLY